MDGYRRVVEVLKSLGHPIRLQIMEILGEEGEVCVCHLEHVLGLRQAYISQQLARLREAGLIENRRDGLNIFYSLKNDESIVCLEDLKEMVAAISRDGGKLKFERSRKKTGASCPCPSCREKRLASSTFLTTLRERIISIRR
jgi:DNA-binding transcriptional ArsR family regulator